MTKTLTPDKLTTDPGQPLTENIYRHWKKTFENYIEECGENAPDKLRCLTKYVSHNIYEYFSEKTTFEAAIQVLDGIFIRPKNEIY